jgi:arylsulfatase A-like enzyme
MSRRLARLLPLAALALLLLAPAARAEPNVVVVMTDDQALSQMRALPKTRALIGGAGVKFERSYAAQPKCCPNRATFLTGQYPHNHGVRDNEPPNGGYQALDHSETLPVWLDRAGYRTAFIGKYMNGYNRVRDIPPGWDEWAGMVDFGYYDFALNVDGERVDYGSAPADYQTDVLADRAADFIDRSAPAAEPFFLWVAPQAPHIAGVRSDIGEPDNPQGAPRHQGDYKGAIAPRTPNYNEKDVSDKPRYIRRQKRLSRQQKTKIDRHFRSTLESLGAVDDMVARLRNRLHARGELADTLFVFTSDNGYFFGNHRSFCCKDEIYEEAARVPLLVRGPGMPGGVVRNQLVSSVDLAPTILELTGATPGRVVDGRSLLVPARRPGAGAGRELLIETFNDRFFAVRSGKWKYARNQFTGEEQLFNVANDPHELRSLHGDRRYRDVELRLRQRLAQLKACAGASCR